MNDPYEQRADPMISTIHIKTQQNNNYWSTVLDMLPSTEDSLRLNRYKLVRSEDKPTQNRQKGLLFITLHKFVPPKCHTASIVHPKSKFAPIKVQSA